MKLAIAFALLGVASATTAKEHLMGRRAGAAVKKQLADANKDLAELDRSTKAMLKEIDAKDAKKKAANMRFVSTHATVTAATPKKDVFGYGEHRFKQMAEAKAKATAAVAAKAKAPAASGMVPSSPYEYMSPSGRGFQVRERFPLLVTSMPRHSKW